MKSIFMRIVTIILMPCLLIDPSSARAFAVPSEHVLRPAQDLESSFQKEALNFPLGGVVGAIIKNTKLGWTNMAAYLAEQFPHATAPEANRSKFLGLGIIVPGFPVLLVIGLSIMTSAIVVLRRSISSHQDIHIFDDWRRVNRYWIQLGAAYVALAIGGFASWAAVATRYPLWLGPLAGRHYPFISGIFITGLLFVMVTCSTYAHNCLQQIFRTGYPLGLGTEKWRHMADEHYE